MFHLIVLAAALTTVSGSELAPFGESRMASDLASFDWLEVRNEPGSSWVLAAVMPAPSSGQLRAPGAYVQDGQLVVPEGSAWESFIEGTMDIREVLTGPAQRGRLEYRWRHPAFARLPEDRALHSPFRDAPGLVICQIVEGAQGAARFPRVALVPEAWLAALPAARQELAAAAADFTGAPAPAAVRRLEALTRSANPWLVVAGARALWRAGRTAPEVATGDPELRGALAVLELDDGASPDRLLARIRVASSPGEITPIALAALAGATGESPTAYARGQALLSAIRARRGELAADALLDAILDHAPAGTAPSPPNPAHE